MPALVPPPLEAELLQAQRRGILPPRDPQASPGKLLNEGNLYFGEAARRMLAIPDNVDVFREDGKLVFRKEGRRSAPSGARALASDGPIRPGSRAAMSDSDLPDDPTAGRPIPSPCWAWTARWIVASCGGPIRGSFAVSSRSIFPQFRRIRDAYESLEQYLQYREHFSPEAPCDDEPAAEPEVIPPGAAEEKSDEASLHDLAPTPACPSIR